MAFNIGDKVKMNYYHNKIGVIENVISINLNRYKYTRMYTVIWETGSAPETMAGNVLISADEKYNSIW